MMIAQTEIIDTALRGGTLGAQALLFGGLIVLGWVIVSLDRRREKARGEEHAQTRQQFTSLIAYHEAAEKSFTIERAHIQTERVFMRDTLIGVLRDNTEAFSALKAFLEHGHYATGE